MNADEWESCTRLIELASNLPVTLTFRKRVLIVLGCVGQSRIINVEIQNAIEQLERALTRRIRQDDRSAWEGKMSELMLAAVRDQNFELAALARMLRMAFNADSDFRPDYLLTETESYHSEGETPALCELIRDIFGNPFRPVTLDPRWLSSTVLDLAQSIYDEFPHIAPGMPGVTSEFAASDDSQRHPRQTGGYMKMHILADALMDAGCDCEEIINHCRGPGPHVRGCWVIDLLRSAT